MHLLCNFYVYSCALVLKECYATCIYIKCSLFNQYKGTKAETSGLSISHATSDVEFMKHRLLVEYAIIILNLLTKRQKISMLVNLRRLACDNEIRSCLDTRVTKANKKTFGVFSVDSESLFLKIINFS